MPKISIIIPVYNSKTYLRECFDSIFAQTFGEYEIICVDDGSIDGSLDILDEYRIKKDNFVILNQDHKGAGAARNLGLKYARGKYIQFLDSDDYFEPVLLEKMYNFAEKNNADVVVCSYRKVNDKGEVTESRNPNSPINLDKTPLERCFNRSDFPDEIFSLLTPVPWNKLYKKSLIVDNGIEFPDIHICEDIAFVHACIAAAERIFVFDDELINYRFNCTGSMATYRTKYAIDVVKSCLVLEGFLKKCGLYEELKEAFQKAFLNHVRWELTLCNEKDRDAFWAEFKQILPEKYDYFKSQLSKDYITCDYINKIIGDKKIVFWGASFFLQNLLKEEKNKNPRILGIVDKNVASWGKYCGDYKIYSPDELENIQPDGILLTAYNNNEIIYPILKNELEETHPDIELLPNIFV